MMGISLHPFMMDIEALVPGETLRVNHGTHCQAGDETRRRLYLTRTLADPTVTVGFCHNCGEGGVQHDKGFEQYRNLRHSPVQGHLKTIVKEVVEPPSNMIKVFADWPVYAKAWALTHRLVPTQLEQYGIEFDPSSDRVYLPYYRETTVNRRGIDLQGYQLRLVNGTGPKYTTVRKEEARGFSRLRGAEATSSVVVVEDLVSGIHIISSTPAPRHDVIVNYGVKINPLVISAISLYDNIQFWLDNDSDYVISQAEHYARTTALYTNNNISIVKTNKDPKYYTHDQIQATMESAWIT